MRAHYLEILENITQGNITGFGIGWGGHSILLNNLVAYIVNQKRAWIKLQALLFFVAVS
jgi:hypothetical protein